MIIGDPEERAEELKEEIEQDPTVVEDEFYDLRELMSHENNSAQSTAYSAFLSGFKDNPVDRISLIEKLLSSDEGFHQNYGARALARTNAVEDHTEELSEVLPKLINVLDKTEPKTKRSIPFSAYKYIELGPRGFAISAINKFTTYVPESVVSYVSEIITLIDADHYHVRLNASQAISTLADNIPKEVIRHRSKIEEGITHEDETVRENSIKSITSLGTEYPETLQDNQQQLIDRLDDVESDVRKAALEALDELANVDPESVKPATSRISRRMEGGKFEKIRAADVMATIYEAYPEAVEPHSLVPRSRPWPADPEEREQAINRYVAISQSWSWSGPDKFNEVVAESTEDIVELLDDSESGIRSSAEEALHNASRTSPEKVATSISTIIEHAESENSSWRLDSIIENVADSEPETVASHLGTLYDIATEGEGNKTILGAIEKVVQSQENPEISLVSIRGCLTSPNTRVRRRAGRIVAVAAQDGDNNVDPIVSSLYDKLKNYDNDTREAAAHSLGILADEQPSVVTPYIDDLIEFLRDDQICEEIGSTLGAAFTDTPEESKKVISMIKSELSSSEWAINSLANVSQYIPEKCIDTVEPTATLLKEEVDRAEPASRVLNNITNKHPTAASDIISEVIKFLERECEGLNNAINIIENISYSDPELASKAVPQLTQLLNSNGGDIYINKKAVGKVLAQVAQNKPEAVVSSVYDLYEIVDEEQSAGSREWMVRTLSYVETANSGTLDPILEDINHKVNNSKQEQQFVAEILAAVATVSPYLISDYQSTVAFLITKNDSSIKLHAARATVYLRAASQNESLSLDRELKLQSQLEEVENILTDGLGKSPYKRTVATEAVGQLTELNDPLSDETISELYNNINNGSRYVRKTTAETLGKIESEEVVSKLEELTDDDYAIVADAAATAINRTTHSNQHEPDEKSDYHDQNEATERKPSLSKELYDASVSGSAEQGILSPRQPNLTDLKSPPRIDLSYDNIHIDEAIGSGGQGIVYRATTDCGSLDETIALKQPQQQNKTLHKKLIEGFHSEAKIWKMIDTREREKSRWKKSEHIVGIVDTGEQLPWIAMEYMDGGSLGDRMRNCPDGFPIEEALWISECISRGVELAHNYGIAHLDLKPENILFRETDANKWDVPKLADWGISRRLAEQTGTIEALSVKYAAPEQFEPQEFGDPDMLTDVYQVGALLYALFTGNPPYTGNRLTVMRGVIGDETPSPLTDVRPELPEKLDQIILKSLSREKSERYRTIGMLTDEIHSLRTQI